MYQPAYHAPPSTAAMLDLIEATRLATLVSIVEGEAVIDHLPFVLDRERQVLQAHVARANPVWRALQAGTSVVAIFQGPAHYLSPAWYPSKAEHGKVVPTWNYLAVHVRGRATLIEGLALLPLLERLIAANERPLHGEHHWKASDAPDDYIAPMLKAIVGFEIAVTELQGRWKLAQDESPQDRLGAITGLTQLATPQSLVMSALIQSTLTQETSQ